MEQGNNGESLPQPDRPKSDRHNAKCLTFAKRQAIIYALANDESICSITRDLRVSRHNVLPIREQYPQEIEEAQKRIKALIEERYYHLQLKALDKIERQIAGERSTLRLLKICDAMTDKMQLYETPPQSHPYPLSIKFAALRRPKRNGLSLPSA